MSQAMTEYQTCSPNLTGELSRSGYQQIVGTIPLLELPIDCHLQSLRNYQSATHGNAMSNNLLLYSANLAENCELSLLINRIFAFKFFGEIVARSTDTDIRAGHITIQDFNPDRQVHFSPLAYVTY